MKFFYRKFLTALLFLFFAFNAKAVNDTLTIGQVFDWKVGDSLVYHRSAWRQLTGLPPFTTITLYFEEVGFMVESRNNYLDTIVYNIKWTNGNADTLIFSQLDTPAIKFNYSLLYPHLGGCQELTYTTSCDSPGVQCTINPVGYPSPIDSLTSVSITWWNFETYGGKSFTEKIGLRGAYWEQAEFQGPTPGGCGIKLAYFKSDSILWLDSTYYFPNSISKQTPIPTFRLSPNPASDEITITTENTAPVDVFIYDMLGNCVLTNKNFSVNMGNISVSFLPPGYYLLKLTDQHGLSSSKGFIIAR